MLSGYVRAIFRRFQSFARADDPRVSLPLAVSKLPGAPSRAAQQGGDNGFSRGPPD